MLTECEKKGENTLLINEERVTPKLSIKDEMKQSISNVWYLDNGSSNHMSGQRSKFKELNEQVTGQVKFEDGSTVNIEGKGSVVFRYKNGEEKELKDVYYIPSLCNNIISIGQLSEEGNKAVFSGDFVWIYENQGRLLMKVKRSVNRLYKIILKTVTASCMISSKIEDFSWLWHLRLGHVNFQALNLMSTTRMVRGMPKICQPKKVCTSCLLSKQTQRPFPAQTLYKSKEVLELIHGDLCGPIMPETLLETSISFSWWMIIVESYGFTC